MAVKNDYRSTLQLPKTAFSMKGNLLQMEPRLQSRWLEMGLYSRMQNLDRPLGSFTFHDGPPYANGPIHVGHLLNKTLKDLVVRSKIMAGYTVDFVPGWDCHGLPIEHKVLKLLGPRAKDLETVDIRRRCKNYAEKYVRMQSDQLQRLGTIARYEDPYLTMDSEYEADVLEVFARLTEEGLIYRDLKPVHWSIENQTALADAELEYHDRKDRSIFVNFLIENPERLPTGLSHRKGPVSLMVWTTTPWTLPANQAVAVAPAAEYVLVRYRQGESSHLAIVARKLVDVIFKDRVQRVEIEGGCLGHDLVEVGIAYQHPFMERTGRVVAADYVTLNEGTGLVHTAPGHGSDDYNTGIKEGLPINCPVLGDGTFDKTVPRWIQGKTVWDANSIIIDKLSEDGTLFFQEEFLHSYPHDWRSKTPTIFRATDQWFVAVDQPYGSSPETLRNRALEAAKEDISFVPDWGRNRLVGMLEARPDWCISRQRAWGLPIPAFFGPDGDLLLTPASIRAVSKWFALYGSDSWFFSSPDELLSNYQVEEDPDAPEWFKDKKSSSMISRLVTGGDIFDVWFESGSSWNAVLKANDLGYPADLYLEGSDQHRGWFQLSMLPALGVTGVNPFRTVLTHGFMVDAQGHKMSKSSGNAIQVKDILKQYGADVCRWWVSSLNYTNDVKVDWEFFRVASEEYRKIRNTIRFLLGNLNDFDSDRMSVELTDEDLFSVDAWMMQELAEFVKRVKGSYAVFDFKTASETIFNFCNHTLSAVYLAAVKDRLYCDSPDSRRRRRAQTVMNRTADVLIRLVAPILVHTAEEAWLVLVNKDEESEGSVHLLEAPEQFEYQAAPEWEEVMFFRNEAMKRLEEAKAPQGKDLKNPLDTSIHATISEERMKTLSPFLEELADLCGVSQVQLQVGHEIRLEVIDIRDLPKCERSWKRDGSVKERSDGGWLSDRDASALGLLCTE